MNEKQNPIEPGRIPPAQGRQDGFRPVVVVKFRDHVELPYEDKVERYLEEAQIGPWGRLAELFPGISCRRLFTQSPSEINKLVARARELDRTYRPPNLLTYFQVDYPAGVDPDALAGALRTWEAVQTAYVDRPGPDPVVNAADDPNSANQGYLDPAPDGIDAEYAWGFAGGDGAGIGFVDMERGWTLDHEDLVAHGAALLHGVLLNTSRAHGTAVLGEVGAVDNALGCVGIAPNLGSMDVVSYNGSTRPDAILAAADSMAFGDVLLLEAQITLYTDGLGRPVYGPIEALDADFDAIRLATALGIVVVEAGGNGTNNGSAPAVDFDAYTNGAGLAILNRDAANPDFRDSGAILVTAASSASPHTRLAYGPYGRRVDCYAWGQNVETCYSNNAGATDLYTSGFSGTSSASPIIAGAALLVQGIAEAQLGYRFGPRQMRAILSDPDTGTAPDPAEATAIGVLPNLRAIVDDVVQASPDVYIRDFVGDTGDPHAGAISASPDIILRPVAVADPQAEFGEGSGTENDATLGYEAEEAQDNYLYVRVRNRGGAPADVDAQIFWSPPATLLTPDLWTRVPLGSAVSATIPNVPTGDLLTVSDAITWPAAEVPGQGHYCFVGLIGTADDPAPDPAEFLDWDNYRRFIRDNNNVTWRNFNVVPNVPNPEAGDPEAFVGLPFLAPGAPDRARRMQLVVNGRLPKGAEAWLEAPLWLVDAMNEWSPGVKIDEKRGTAWLRLGAGGRRRFGEAVFPAKSRSALRLLVSIPKELRKQAYDIWVGQFFEGEEVGRVTWRLAPPRDKKRLNSA